MAGRDKFTHTVSFAGKEPGLRDQMPLSLQRVSALCPSFEAASDPFLAAQRRDLEKSEGQRREESGSGSMMVKRQRLSPKLRPKHDHAPIRASFNQAWFQEHRAARLEQFKAERRHNAQTKARVLERPKSGRAWIR